jgi:hypothetical protein
MANTLDGGPRELRHTRGLHFLQVSKQCTRGGDSAPVLLLEAEAIEVSHVELSSEVLTRHGFVELPRLALRDENAIERGRARQRRQAAVDEVAALKAKSIIGFVTEEQAPEPKAP